MSYMQPNYSRLTPCVIVEDVKKSMDFYTQVFGFDLLEKHEREGVITGATLKLGEVTFMLFSKLLSTGAKNMSSEPITNAGNSLYAYCPDVDMLYENALKHGAVSLIEPEDAFWGDRYCQLRDPDGYTWCFATYKQVA